MAAIKSKSAVNEVIDNWLKNCLDLTTEPPTKSCEDLRIDARTFFEYISKNTQVVTETNLVLQTKSSHEESLVQLVKDLGPAFVQEHHQCRLRALHVLVGGLEGCRGTQLSSKVLKLLGQFLINHCGPVDDEEYGEDYDTMIRDIAVQGLASLVSVKTTSATTSSINNNDQSYRSDDDLTGSILDRMEFAKTAISRRCAIPDLDDSPNPYGFAASKPDIRGGLSTLPRSKRAICFQLLQKAINGITSLFPQIKDPFRDELVYTNIQSQMVDFARFTASCLQGESDPRCLQQLLQVISEMQIGFAPWFVASYTSPEAIFPIEDVFDAVAPYFPVQFTPPPNNIHGITREGLHKALMSVLTFTRMDEGALKFHHQPMMTLSADLFLEILLPAPEDDNPGPLDKLEALECLSVLFLPKESPAAAMNLMEERIAVALSQALKATHDEASLGVGQGGQSGVENKRLADYCRTFLARLAYNLEQSSNKKLWDIIICQPLQELSNKIKSSPSGSKTSIAYIACLAACGGSRTLRTSLSLGLRPLLDFLNSEMGDNEGTAAATHGIGAFCSSANVSMERAKHQGLVLHPHPLDDYSEDIANMLLRLFGDKEHSDSIKVAAVQGIECLLIAGAAGQVSNETEEKICSFYDILVFEDTPEHSTLSNTLASALGNILGIVLSTNSETSDFLATSPKLKKHITDTVYPSLVPNIETPSSRSRRGLQALAIASSQSAEVANPIMASCLESFFKSISDNGPRSEGAAGEAVSHLLRYGGEMAASAFHASSKLDEIFDYIDEFAKSRSYEGNKNLSTELESIKNMTRLLAPAFRSYVPQGRVLLLLKRNADIIPPLSESDNFRICVWLPILADALRSQDLKQEDTDDPEQKSIETYAGQLNSGLADIMTTASFDSETRCAAGACLFGTVLLNKSNKKCPIESIFSNSIVPTLSTTRGSATAQNFLKIIGLLAAAASTRGGTSAKTGDKLSKFLLEVACNEKTKISLMDDPSVPFFDPSIFDDEEAISIAAASAYGSILSLSSLKPLMKQRITHGSFKYIKAAYGQESDHTHDGQLPKTPSVGLLLVVSFVLCFNDFTKFDKTLIHQMSTLVVEGLSSPLFQNGKSEMFVSKNLLLTATLKLISVVPSALNGLSLSIVTGLLRAYAVSDPLAEVASKLLALQGLEAIARMEGTRSSASTMKPAVVAVLAAATNHPSALLRQAAVDVRNAWYVLD